MQCETTSLFTQASPLSSIRPKPHESHTPRLLRNCTTSSQTPKPQISTPLRQECQIQLSPWSTALNPFHHITTQKQTSLDATAKIQASQSRHAPLQPSHRSCAMQSWSVTLHWEQRGPGTKPELHLSRYDWPQHTRQSHIKVRQPEDNNRDNIMNPMVPSRSSKQGSKQHHLKTEWIDSNQEAHSHSHSHTASTTRDNPSPHQNRKARGVCIEKAKEYAKWHQDYRN
jgi:hypothetical protein